MSRRHYCDPILFFDYLRTCRRSLADCKSAPWKLYPLFTRNRCQSTVWRLGRSWRARMCICARGHSCVATTLGDARKAFAAASSEPFVSLESIREDLSAGAIGRGLSHPRLRRAGRSSAKSSRDEAPADASLVDLRRHERARRRRVVGGTPRRGDSRRARGRRARGGWESGCAIARAFSRRPRRARARRGATSAAAGKEKDLRNPATGAIGDATPPEAGRTFRGTTS